ncbi:MAG: CotH kinase family protein [Clostridia bacterium]|nr:CotH kinase family protein [Clostridia bacterium]
MRNRYIPLVLCIPALICLLTGCNRSDLPSPPDGSAEAVLTEAPTDVITLPEDPPVPTDAPAAEDPPAEPPAEETRPIDLPFPVPTDELPVLSVHTDGVAVDSRSYVDMTMTLTGVADPLVNVSGSIRLRGNSTYSFPKKPYRIKLDQKHSLFGLDKAKSWVLLADWLDPSTLHNYAALTLAKSSEHFDFVPTPHKVNLYMNGEYAGVYTLCEQVQEQAGRLDLEMEIKRSMTELSDYNFLICLNYNAPEKPGAEEGVTYFYLSNCDRYFELEYPTREDFPSEAQFNRFFGDLEDYMRETVNAFRTSDRRYLNENVDTDTLIDLFIVDQIMGERDHHWKSVFMYYKGADGDEKLHFGPPWDYDFCMFTEWTSEPNEEFDLSNKFNPAEASVFFRPFLDSSYFSRKVKTRYEQHFSEALDGVIADVEAMAAAMPESLHMNQDTWYADKPTITEDNVSFFVKYLKHRKSTLDREWG